jgi:oligopeptidase A
VLFDRMIAAKNFQSGLQMLRQLELALLDMRLHTLTDPDRLDPAGLLRIVDEVRDEVAVVFPPPFHRGVHAFAHIFAGAYAAGYYSYKWAEVLSADCWSAFEDSGAALAGAQGSRFRDEILSVGGSRPALDSFIAFRGRAPAIDALLRHSGMAA